MQFKKVWIFALINFQEWDEKLLFKRHRIFDFAITDGGPLLYANWL